MSTLPPDWQLPPGVSRGLWSYVHDDALAQNYDFSLTDNRLIGHDVAFVERHCSKPGRFVDLGCGTGRLAVAMAGAGHEVLAVDLSAAMLRRVGEKAAAANVTVHRLQANIVQLEAIDDATFDGAACLFSTLGMVAGADARRRVVGHVHRLLRPGGVFVVHVHNRWFNFWNPTGRRWLLGDVARSLLRRPSRGDRAMPAHGDTPALTLHLFTKTETICLLRQAGFAIREVRAVSLRPDGRLRWPWWFGWLRWYGYLIAAYKEART